MFKVRCEAEYTKSCMSHDQMCHSSYWQKLVNGSLISCVRGCTLTRLMMTARCISNPDAPLPTDGCGIRSRLVAEHASQQLSA